MKKRLCLALIVSMMSAGCGLLYKGNDVAKFDATAHDAVITQTHTTGAVAPTYYHTDQVVIFSDGAWQATRTYPYTRPPSTTAIASGSMSASQLQALVNMAYTAPSPGEPRFMDLPAQNNSGAIGGGTRTIALSLDSGSHSVSVVGKAPTAFQQLDDAIASDTVALTP